MIRRKSLQLAIGAMFVAIVGALLVLDQYVGHLFADITPIVIAAMIIYYSVKISLKKSFMLSTCILFIGMITGNLTTYIYVPVGILVGTLTSLAYVRSESNKSMPVMFISYCLAELMVCVVIMPLMGVSLSQQVTGSYQILQNLNMPFAYEISIISLGLTAILIGLIESMATMSLATILLKRF